MENSCHKVSLLSDWTKKTPKGIVVHSTGCSNPWLKRYVQPDDGNLGVNQYNNSWNTPSGVCHESLIYF